MYSCDIVVCTTSNHRTIGNLLFNRQTLGKNIVEHGHVCHHAVPLHTGIEMGFNGAGLEDLCSE